jgi:hypothetical protein
MLSTMQSMALLLLVLGGCGFVQGTNDPWPLDAGGDGEASVTIESNPVGEACPTTNIGHTTHTRIANLKFQGYKANGTNVLAPTGTLTTISLCDFYNPTGKNGNYKILHIAGAALWCGPCSVETSGISGYDGSRNAPGVAADLAPLGVVFVQVLFQGDSHTTPASVKDLEVWMNGHQSNFTSGIDPFAAAFHEFTDGNNLPWNADIDLRSMEILGASIGASSSLEDDMKALLAKQSNTPPMQ